MAFDPIKLRVLAEKKEDENWRFRPFLKDNRCSVYEDRPGNCRGHPYLHEPDFVFRTMGMIQRTSICPIVYDVLEELKPAVGFRRREK